VGRAGAGGAARVGAVGAGTGGGAGIAVGATAGRAAAKAASMSALTIRPPGPVPLIARRSSPAWAAIRRARGLAKIRPSDVPAAAAGTAGGAAAGAGVAGFTSPSPSAGAVAPAGAGGASSALASSPSPNKSAIGVFTLTPSVPAGTRILPITPSSTASTSIVALSVSISAITSPGRTGSPSFLSQRARLPSVMVGDKAGMRIGVGISPPPRSRLQARPTSVRAAATTSSTCGTAIRSRLAA
jgi:hypothetical protein